MDTHDTHRLLGLQVQNFQRLHVVEVRPNATGLTPVRGKNAQGKSSVLDALEVALRGLRSAHPRPIRDGADRAEVVVELSGGLRVRRTFTDPEDRSKGRLVLENADGATYPRPSERLAAMVRENVDPTALLRMQPRELAEHCLRLVEVPVDLDGLEAEIAAALERRRDVARDLKRVAAACDEAKAEAEGAPDAPPDTAALAEELAEVDRHNAEGDRITGELTDLHHRRTRCQDRVADAESEIERLRDALARAEQEYDRAQGDLDEVEELVEAVEKREADFQPRDRDAVLKRLQSAQADGERYQARVRLERLREDHKAAFDAHHEAEESVASLRATRASALEDVDWPHDGLGYDPEAGTLTLNGQPFQQASKAERLMAAADLAMAQDAPVPLLLVRDGNDLDADHLAMLDQRVRERGWQMLVELVADEDVEGAAGVYIEDGRVAGAAEEDDQ